MRVGNEQVEVVRKRIGSMYLYVMPPDGHLKVSAPVGTNNKTIIRFVEERLDWVYIKRQEMTERQERHERDIRNIEKIHDEGLCLLWGKLNRIPTGMYEQILRQPDLEKKELILIELYRSELKEKMVPFINKWQTLTGLTANEWRTKNMKTRWGSCNIVKKRIWLNPQLAKKPVECMDYVILHELCHLVERGHGEAFKTLMDKYMPDWRERKRLLNKQE